jgi:hypothetical protein
LWREALLAQSIISGRTAAYRNHPQAIRVLEQEDPWGAMHDYLMGVWDEGHRRGYRYNRSRILQHDGHHPMDVPRGQVEYEAVLLRSKLEVRNPAYLNGLPPPGEVQPHPSIRVVDGGIAWWERPRGDLLRHLGKMARD